jgi:hypothetical protein
VEGGSAVPRSMTVPMAAMALSVLVIGVVPNLLQWLTALAGADVVAWIR